uniref:Uncharacterized protein n=1 Tax=Physcomitrium patens TaxID=3218 RepID=A0A2K1KC99_PHYPA|nr:hypothetical protein PHYPA_010578 [Physcomitrium patens]
MDPSSHGRFSLSRQHFRRILVSEMAAMRTGPSNSSEETRDRSVEMSPCCVLFLLVCFLSGHGRPLFGGNM